MSHFALVYSFHIVLVESHSIILGPSIQNDKIMRQEKTFCVRLVSTRLKTPILFLSEKNAFKCDIV